MGRTVYMRPEQHRAAACHGFEQIVATDRDEAAIAIATAMLQQGKEPSEIAEIVLQSIQDDHFYILPHPAWDDIVRKRVEHILGRVEPVTMDLEDMMRRRAAGEKF